MAASTKALAGLLGPALLAISATEALNLETIAVQSPSVVYLNGAILFVGGLALVQAHNRWRGVSAILVTLVGWAALGLGLARMIFPKVAYVGVGVVASLLLAGLFLTGALLTFIAYRPERSRGGPARR